MPPRILLVEDEPLLREMIQQDLEDLGFSVVASITREEGLEAIKSDESFDLLITDIRTPGHCDGWELARRARQFRPQLGVVYITGYSADAPQPVSDSVLVTKPFRLTELERALAQCGFAR